MAVAAAHCVLLLVVTVPLIAARRNSEEQHALSLEESEEPPYRDWYSHPLKNEPYYYHAPAIRYVDASTEDQAEMLDGIACFCKKVQLVSDCPSVKLDKSGEETGRPEDPSRFRWYHRDQDLCCKMAFTYSMKAVGWSYKRQETVNLCVSELRPVASDECCHLKDKSGVIGLHVEQTRAYLYLKAFKSFTTPWSGVVRSFYRSLPVFELGEVTGATDFTGKSVESDTVRAFLQNVQDTGRYAKGFECSDLEEADPDKASCTLRQQAATQCCCHQATVTAARRCLPVKGAPGDIEPVWVEAVITEVLEHGHKKGTMTFGESPDTREGIPEFVSSADPEAVDDPNTAANESAMIFTWGRINQWEMKCAGKQPVPWVRAKSHSSRYQCGTRHSPSGPAGISTPQYCTRHWTTYHQEYKDQCVSRMYTRACPPGQGLYEKQFPPGTCADEPSALNADELQLVDIGNLSFMCPEEYRSGTSGGLRFDPLCECADLC